MRSLTKTMMMAAVATSVAVSSPSLAADIKAGEKVFKKCKACHVVDAEE